MRLALGYPSSVETSFCLNNAEIALMSWDLFGIRIRLLGRKDFVVWLNLNNEKVIAVFLRNISKLDFLLGSGCSLSAITKMSYLRAADSVSNDWEWFGIHLKLLGNKVSAI